MWRQHGIFEMNVSSLRLDADGFGTVMQANVVAFVFVLKRAIIQKVYGFYNRVC